MPSITPTESLLFLLLARQPVAERENPCRPRPDSGARRSPPVARLQLPAPSETPPGQQASRPASQGPQAVPGSETRRDETRRRSPPDEQPSHPPPQTFFSQFFSTYLNTALRARSRALAPPGSAPSLCTRRKQ